MARRSVANGAFATHLPDLQNLPRDLKEAILEKVKAQLGISAAVKMRLLSKAWRSAFDTYQGRLAYITLKAKGSHHFQKVCSMLPQMGSLNILTTRVITDFAAISSLGRLTRLRLSPENHAHNFPDPKPCLSIGKLPVSLKEISLDYVKLRDTDSLHLPYLTRLCLYLGEEFGNDLHFLSHLPALKVCLSTVC